MLKKIKSKISGLSENNRIVLFNMAGAFAVKGGALVISLFTMPAYLRFFDNEVALGLWFTVLSVLNWILNFDLGIGNGLRNNLARSIAEKNSEQSKKYISSAYVSVGILCLLITVVFSLLFGFVDWNKVFNISSQIVSQKALLTSVRIVFLGVMLQLFFKLINSILYAIQKSSVNNFLTLCTSVITLLSVLVLPSGTNDRNMICMAIIHVCAVILPLIVATVVVFATKLKNSRPSIKKFSALHAKQVLSLGGMFLFVQLEYMVIMTTNEYLITLFKANENVVDYQVYHRLFLLGSTIFSLALTPVWSAITKASAEKNNVWIDSLYKKMVKFAIIASAVEFLIVPVLQPIVDIWLGANAIDVNIHYATVFAFLGSSMIFNSVLSSVANGLGKLKVQAVCFGVGAVLKIPLSRLFVTAFNGWIGVVLANAVCLFIYCLIQPIYIKKHLKISSKE